MIVNFKEIGLQKDATFDTFSRETLKKEKY